MRNLMLKTASGQDRMERLSDVLRGYGQVLRQSFKDPRPGRHRVDGGPVESAAGRTVEARPLRSGIPCTTSAA
ncbi:MAG: hypothetical protein R2838_26660 [Caldilineaceae bacterium]